LLLDRPTTILPDAWPEFKVTWQLSGEPDVNVSGHASAAAFTPTKASVVCTVVDPMVAAI